MIRIELLGPPKGKGRPRFVRATGHAYTPAPTREYEQALRAQAMIQMKGARPIERPVKVDVYAYQEIPKSWRKVDRDAARYCFKYPSGKPDADNYLKIALDSLNQVVWLDDGQVVKASVSKKYSDEPKLVVEVAVI